MKLFPLWQRTYPDFDIGEDAEPAFGTQDHLPDIRPCTRRRHRGDGQGTLQCFNRSSGK